LAEVSAGIIHQIGQPLTAAMNNLSAAATLLDQLSGTSAPLKEAMADAESCLRQVRLTMDRLRALKHSDRAATEPVNLDDLALEVLRVVAPEAGAKQVDLQHQPHAAPVEIMADSVQLSQALLNVLRNALEAAASNPAARARVVVRTQVEGAQAIVLVSDSGPGIPAELFPRLFQPFFSTKTDGMGVGLSLAQTITHAHRGTIEAFNNGDGGGATFCLRFPRRMG
jgi:signal transduction histidine kinase